MYSNLIGFTNLSWNRIFFSLFKETHADKFLFFAPGNFCIIMNLCAVIVRCPGQRCNGLCQCALSAMVLFAF